MSSNEFEIVHMWKQIERESGDAYRFPEPLSPHMKNRWNKPAIYRWVIYRDVPGDLNTLYIGEAADLYRRINGYLKPGPSQQTNIRMNALFHEALVAGDKITLEYLVFEPFSIQGMDVSSEHLLEKPVRLLLENWFVFYYTHQGLTILNI